MKKLLLFAAILFSTALISQEKETKIESKDVPEAVMKKFMAFYGDVKKVKWEKEGDRYEASFKQNKVKTSVTLTADGNIVQKAWGIKKTDVPKAVADSVMKNFAGLKVEEWSKIERSGMTSYEAEVEGKKDGKDVEYKLIYSSDGKLIEKKDITD